MQGVHASDFDANFDKHRFKNIGQKLPNLAQLLSWASLSLQGGPNLQVQLTERKLSGIKDRRKDILCEIIHKHPKKTELLLCGHGFVSSVHCLFTSVYCNGLCFCFLSLLLSPR